MKMGEVIRTYRKEKQLTQEEMASRLGVSAPAVNKWENGNSCPDISLLAPIARLLGISTDTLLSFREDLTDQEISQILWELDGRMRTESYGEAFGWVMQQLKEYPNCESLAFSAAQILDGYRGILNIPDPEAYDTVLENIYRRTLQSGDSRLVQSALTALFHNSLNKGDYDAAQGYLDQMPRKSVDADRYQALLYKKQDKREESYELLERLLFSGCSDLNWSLQALQSMALEEGDLPRAEQLAEKQTQLAKLLEMGTYMENAPRLCILLETKDRDGCLDLLKLLAESIGQVEAFRESGLYRHMKFSSGNDGSNIAFMLKKGLEEDPGIGFLKEDERFEEILKELERKSGGKE